MFAIDYIHPEFASFAENYITDEPEIERITVTQTDIGSEREKSEREDINSGRRIRFFRDSYLETLAVYRKIAEILPRYDTVLFHGSAIAVDGVGYLFSAKSGTGKSTHAGLWREYLGESAVMINDDKPLLRITDEGSVVCGTPWDGKHHLSTNCSVPLEAICFLEQAKENWIVPISKREAYPLLLQQVYRPADVDSLKKTLVLLDRLSAAVSLWRMGCTIDPEAAKMAYEAMRG